VNESAPFHDQVSAWLFGAGVTTHILLVAGLRNPTVRRRYRATRELLAEYNLGDAYEPFLEALGCARMTRERATRHLHALTETFDRTKAVIRTPYRFAADLSDEGRVVAIDGSREMIEAGDHREAVFWMVATFSRCQAVLANDGDAETQARSAEAYRHLLADIGITSRADLRERYEQVARSLPTVWEIAETILDANPEIQEP
jgi:hypothetical protein